MPVPTEMLPELPDVVVPELKIRAPLMPLVPEWRDRIVTEPLVDNVPDPPNMDTAPPVAPLPLPAVNSIEPPWPVVPVWVVVPPTIVTLPP